MTRKIEVEVHITFGNGSKRIFPVRELPIPITVTEMKEGELKDEPLEIQIKSIQDWIRMAINNQLQRDNQPDAGLG